MADKATEKVLKAFAIARDTILKAWPIDEDPNYKPKTNHERCVAGRAKRAGISSKIYALLFPKGGNE